MSTAVVAGPKPMRQDGAAYDLLSWLLVMPLLDAFELQLLAEWPLPTVRQALRRLQREGLAASVPALLPGAPATARWYLTVAGVDAVAGARSVSPETLLRRHPVSAHWINLLLARLETVAGVYRVATLLAEVSAIRGFRWYRKHPLDALLELEGGKVLGVMREGRYPPPGHLGRRLWTLVRSPRPDTLVILAPDRQRLRDWRRPAARLSVTTFLACERDLADADADTPLLYPPSDPEPLPVRGAAGLFRGGTVPVEPPPAHLEAPEPDLSRAARNWLSSGGLTPHTVHYLPIALSGASKELMTVIGLWPWIAMTDLEGMLGLTKARVLQILDRPLALRLVLRAKHGSRVRYVLSDRGLRFLARANRLATPGLLLRWSPSLRDPDAPLSWRNVRGSRARQLLRDIEHTSAVHRFVAAMARQTRERGGRVLLLEPAHRAARRFEAPDGTKASINPDAYCVIEVDGEPFHFFLEWERRAAHPALLKAKLAPYVRYYATRQPVEDFGAYPTLLVVLRDEVTEVHFLEIAREELAWSEARGLRALASHAAAIEREELLKTVWVEAPGGNRRSLF